MQVKLKDKLSSFDHIEIAVKNKNERFKWSKHTGFHASCRTWEI